MVVFRAKRYSQDNSGRTYFLRHPVLGKPGFDIDDLGDLREEDFTQAIINFEKKHKIKDLSGLDEDTVRLRQNIESVEWNNGILYITFRDTKTGRYWIFKFRSPQDKLVVFESNIEAGTV